MHWSRFRGFIDTEKKLLRCDPTQLVIVGGPDPDVDVGDHEVYWWAFSPRAAEAPDPTLIYVMRTANRVRDPVHVFPTGDVLIVLDGRRRVTAARVIWREQTERGVPVKERVSVPVLVSGPYIIPNLLVQITLDSYSAQPLTDPQIQEINKVLEGHSFNRSLLPAANPFAAPTTSGDVGARPDKGRVLVSGGDKPASAMGSEVPELIARLSSQRKVDFHALVKLADHYAAEQAHGRRRRRTPRAPRDGTMRPREVVNRLSAVLGLHPRSVRRLLRIGRAQPELIAAVNAGELPLNDADHIAALPREEQLAALAVLRR